MTVKIIIAFLFCLNVSTNGDIYMHNPRGSNNRLDEAKRERNNANRLFDSQNNNRGGYNVGGVYYYVGSKVPVEWTNQHSCGNDNNHCELIVQYMCGDSVRDGATTSTIPDNPMSCENYDCNTDTRYGMHENFDYYLKCKLRERNKGLFLADQNLKNRNRAKNTRQNPNGNRRGYECPEERDYYPYWHPTPWKDLIVMTNDATRCPYYQEESENVKGRWECVLPMAVMVTNVNKGLEIPNNKEDCDNFVWPINDPNGVKGVWTERSSHNLTAPECRETEFSRDNHLGNGLNGYPNLFNWTVPDTPHEHCVIRIRYNISTAEYEAWDGVDASNNEERNVPAKVGLAERYGFGNGDDAENRGYNFENNPQVQIFNDLAKVKLQLAINTAQYGRTFQDRSHSLAIRRRPDDLKTGLIHNINVRGKRGNIVQVYPAVEYDFVPNTLEVKEGDYIHFQWTGSNTNPNNNDGQGQAGSDRSNVILQREHVYLEGKGQPYSLSEKYGHWGRSYPEMIYNSSLLGLSEEDKLTLALLQPFQFRGEMSELDDAGTYFDLGPRKVTGIGTYHYLSTRNNNFSNRSQKGRIIVSESPKQLTAIGWNGGQISVPGTASLNIPPATFTELHTLQVEEWSEDRAETHAASLNKEIRIGDGYASNFLVIHPEQKLTTDDKAFEIEMEVNNAGVDDVVIYKTTSGSFSSWTKVNADINGGKASFAAQEGGVYVAVRHSKTGLIVGAVIGCLFFLAILVGGTYVYHKRNPLVFNNLSRSFQSKV